MIANVALMMTQAAAVSAPAPPTSIQQAFDAASKLDVDGTPAARLAAWRALEAKVAHNRRTAAIVRVREGAALLALAQRDDAAAALRSGLADLPANDPTLRGDRYAATIDLALLAEDGLDYASAAEQFRAAEALADIPVDKLSAQIGLIRTSTFVDPDQALAAVARADAVLASSKPGKNVAALVRRTHAELLLNRGDIAGAKVQAAAAVKLLGGLTMHANLDDVSARSDYAIAALLGGDADSAREYLAYTGAGRLPKGAFDPGLGMRVPDCGGEAGLKPADMAVVEFSVADDGRVMLNRPVYAAGGGKVALEFAKAVGDWSWTPEKVQALPPFFRYRVRVEMRCSTAFERPSIESYLDAGLGRWLADKGVELSAPPTGSDAAVLPVLRAQLAAVEARQGHDALALVPILHLIANNGLVGREETNAVATRELAIVERNGGVGVPRLAVERKVWASSRDDEGKFWRERVLAVAAPRYDGNPETRGAIRLMVANAWGRSAGRARGYVQQVASDTALPKDNPIRIAALIRLASLEQQAGQPEAARAAYEQSGVSANACAMIDSPPHFLSAGGTFPQEALRWGFEGWTQVQFDVRADGKVTGERAVISYPPFVFTKAGADTLAGARYSKSFRPDGALGCGGATQRVRFALPG